MEPVTRREAPAGRWERRRESVCARLGCWDRVWLSMLDLCYILVIGVLLPKERMTRREKRNPHRRQWAGETQAWLGRSGGVLPEERREPRSLVEDTGLLGRGPSKRPAW